jgi:hypothetical protein
MGAFWVAPVTSHWYNTLSTRLVPGKANLSRVTKRLMLDQFGFAPLFCPSFMGLLWLLEGQDASTIGRNLLDVAPYLVMANWFLWIPAMTLVSRRPCCHAILRVCVVVFWLYVVDECLVVQFLSKR